MQANKIRRQAVSRQIKQVPSVKLVAEIDAVDAALLGHLAERGKAGCAGAGRWVHVPCPQSSAYVRASGRALSLTCPGCSKARASECVPLPPDMVAHAAKHPAAAPLSPRLGAALTSGWWSCLPRWTPRASWTTSLGLWRRWCGDGSSLCRCDPQERGPPCGEGSASAGCVQGAGGREAQQHRRVLCARPPCCFGASVPRAGWSRRGLIHPLLKPLHRVCHRGTNSCSRNPLAAQPLCYPQPPGIMLSCVVLPPNHQLPCCPHGPQVMYTARPEDNYLDAAINAALQVRRPLAVSSVDRSITSSWPPLPLWAYCRLMFPLPACCDPIPSPFRSTTTRALETSWCSSLDRTRSTRRRGSYGCVG